MKSRFLAFAIAFVFAFLVVAAANAHGHYTDMKNPNGGSCCGGADCKDLPEGTVKEVKGGFIVTLTKDQMVEIRPDLTRTWTSHYSTGGGVSGIQGPNPVFKNLVGGVVEFIPYKEAQPGLGKGYGACLGDRPTSFKGGKPRWISCFFTAGNT